MFLLTSSLNIRDGRQALVDDVMDNVVAPEPPAVGHLIIDEVE